MDAMDLLESEGYTHYRCVYYSMWDDRTFPGGKFPIYPLELTAGYFQDNFEDSGDIAEVILYKEL